MNKHLLPKGHRSIFHPDFIYRRSGDTNIEETFKRVRQVPATANATVQPICQRDKDCWWPKCSCPVAISHIPSENSNDQT